jgi:hypothetical protein
MMTDLSKHQAARLVVRNGLISAYTTGGIKAVVREHDALPEGSHEYARDWLESFGSGTWQNKAARAIERSAYAE